MSTVDSSRTEPVALPWAVAWRLAAGQIVAWGILYYAFTVVVGPMQAGTGWSRTFLNTGLSLGLLAWGLCALPAGAWIQHKGGRELMTAASALGGAALVLMGALPNRTVYLIAWLMLGVAMAGMLYDSAFAVVTQAFGSHYRRGITLITLVGGFASTVFIPLAQVAVDHLGWQQALIALGAFHIALGVPLHALGVPKYRPDRAPCRPTSAFVRWRVWWIEFRRDISDARFFGLALWFTAHAAAFTGLIFLLVPVLQALEVDNATMLLTMSIIGPMQVLGRILLASRGDRFSTLCVGFWAMAALVTALLTLLVLPPRLGWLALFAAVFGAGNGVMTILRGTAIAELFGRERYAELNGALSTPAVIAKAAAPLALAVLWSSTGEPRIVIAAVLLLMTVGVVGLWRATVAHGRHAPSNRAGSGHAPEPMAAEPRPRPSFRPAA